MRQRRHVRQRAKLADFVAGQVEVRQRRQVRQRRHVGDFVFAQVESRQRRHTRQRRHVGDSVAEQVEIRQRRQARQRRHVGDFVVVQLERRQRRQLRQRRHVGDFVLAQVELRQRRQSRQVRHVGDRTFSQAKDPQVGRVFDPRQLPHTFTMQPSQVRHLAAGDRVARRLVQRLLHRLAEGRVGYVHERLRIIRFAGAWQGRLRRRHRRGDQGRQQQDAPRLAARQPGQRDRHPHSPLRLGRKLATRWRFRFRVRTASAGPRAPRSLENLVTPSATPSKS